MTENLPASYVPKVMRHQNPPLPQFGNGNASYLWNGLILLMFTHNPPRCSLLSVILITSSFIVLWALFPHIHRPLFIGITIHQCRQLGPSQHSHADSVFFNIVLVSFNGMVQSWCLLYCVYVLYIFVCFGVS